MKDLKEKATQTTVAKINNTEIVVVENGEKYIPIRPICDALGIDFSVQLKKLKSHPIFGSGVVMNTTTGADGKQYEMATILFKWVFGWLGIIDPRKVKESSRQGVLNYQEECYNVLYNHFTRQSEFLQQRQDAVEQQIEEVDRLRHEFKDADRRMREARAELDRVRSVTFNQWLADHSQLSLFTANEMEG